MVSCAPSGIAQVRQTANAVTAASQRNLLLQVDIIDGHRSRFAVDITRLDHSLCAYCLVRANSLVIRKRETVGAFAKLDSRRRSVAARASPLPRRFAEDAASANRSGSKPAPTSNSRLANATANRGFQLLDT